MQGIYGVVVWFHEKQDKYLVRFTGRLQVDYDEIQILPW